MPKVLRKKLLYPLIFLTFVICLITLWLLATRTATTQINSEAIITENKVNKVIPKLNPQCRCSLPPEHFTKPHLVQPPFGEVTIVCCETSKGIINIAVHLTWAPQGARRFLDMVESRFFHTKVPLFRALKNCLIQFGLAGTCFICRYSYMHCIVCLNLSPL